MTNVPGWLAALGILVPGLAGLLGYWLAGRNEEARDQRTATREGVARHTALAERLDERKHEFQMNLLLELQDVLQRQVRVSAKVIRHDQRTLREQGKLSLLGPELNQESYETGVEFSRLLVRVLDDGLRRGLEAFHLLCSSIDVSVMGLKDRPPDEAIDRLDGHLRELTRGYSDVNEHLGILLRAELGRVPEVPAG